MPTRPAVRAIGMRRVHSRRRICSRRYVGCAPCVRVFTIPCLVWLFGCLLAHGLFLKHHISRVFNRQDAKYAKFPRRWISAGENIDFVGLGDLGVLAVGQIVKLQEKTMPVGP